MDATREEWRPIAGYPGYEVSNFGRVRTLDRVVTDRQGRPRRLRGVIRKVKPQRPSGYMGLSLWRDGKQRTVRVHVLVLESFVGPRPSPDWEGCHNNGDPTDNRLVNLRWDTKAGNAQDALDHGHNASARKTHCAKSGHEFTPENTYINPTSGARQCRQCVRELNARIRRRRSGSR